VLAVPSDEKSLFRYEMHTLPTRSAIASVLTLYAA
jgi:hypothetical protein